MKIVTVKIIDNRKVGRNINDGIYWDDEYYLTAANWCHKVPKIRVCLMKLTRKWKLVRTLGFFSDFFSQLISTTGSWDSLPVCLVIMVTMGPVCLMKLTRKQKLVRTLGFFLDFFPQLISTTGSWDSPPMYLVTMVTMGPVWVCLIKLICLVDLLWS